MAVSFQILSNCAQTALGNRLLWGQLLSLHLRIKKQVCGWRQSTYLAHGRLFYVHSQRGENVCVCMLEPAAHYTPPPFPCSPLCLAFPALFCEAAKGG